MKAELDKALNRLRKTVAITKYKGLAEDLALLLAELDRLREVEKQFKRIDPAF